MAKHISGDNLLLHSIFSFLGRQLSHYLSKPTGHYYEFSTVSPERLRNTLKPGDVLLVDGNTRFSTAIKYLTQSTWSHACLYIGEQQGPDSLLEADLLQGIITVPLSKYSGFNVRICRPNNLTPEDEVGLLTYVTDRIGMQYDLKNVVDLMRYLIPTPPVPQRYRRKLIAMENGDPTKAICSTLLAQAFQHIKYPILPREAAVCMGTESTPNEFRILEKKHYSHFTPRDFDLSPYFHVVKPTLESGFNYKELVWEDSL